MIAFSRHKHYKRCYCAAPSGTKEEIIPLIRQVFVPPITASDEHISRMLDECLNRGKISMANKYCGFTEDYKIRVTLKND